MPSPQPHSLDPKSDASPIHWDELCDLLDGSDWPSDPEVSHCRQQVRPRFSSGRQFLFQDDPVRLPLESLWLKLSAFACLCRRVVEFHERQHHPHLSLNPRHITACPRDWAFTWLPVRWLFAVELDAGKGATPVVHDEMPKEMARSIVLPSQESDPAYAAPVVRQWPMGREVSGTVLLRSIERIPDETNDQVSRGLLRAHVLSDAVPFTDFSNHDTMRITFKLSGNGATTISCWACKVEEAERGVIVRGVSDSIPRPTWLLLERAKQHVFSDARIMIYRAFDHACDLYSLGMLLFRSLLVTSGRKLEQIQHQVGSVLERLEPLVQGLNQNDHWTVFKRVSGRLQEVDGMFSPPSPGVSEYVWYDALIVGLQLVSRIPGFSLYEDTAALDADRVPEALCRARRAAEHLAEQARIELFDVAVRHRELLGVCDGALEARMS